MLVLHLQDNSNQKYAPNPQDLSELKLLVHGFLGLFFSNAEQSRFMGMCQRHFKTASNPIQT